MYVVEDYGGSVLWIFFCNLEFFSNYILGIATNVSVQLLVASMGSINTENMVRMTPIYYYTVCSGLKKWANMMAVFFFVF